MIGGGASRASRSLGLRGPHLTGQLGVFAVEDEIDATVPVLDDLPAFVDLAADRFIGEVVAEEDRASGAAEFCDQLPVDWPVGDDRADRVPRSVCVEPGSVQGRFADLLQAGHQLEAEQFAEPEPDDRGAVGVGDVRCDLDVGVVVKSPWSIAAISDAEQVVSWLWMQSCFFSTCQ